MSAPATLPLLSISAYPCRHCGGQPHKLHSINGAAAHRGVFLACDSCSFQTHQVYINADSDRYLLARWNAGVPFEVIKGVDKKGYGQFKTLAEWFSGRWQQCKPLPKSAVLKIINGNNAQVFFKQHYGWDIAVRANW